MTYDDLSGDLFGDSTIDFLDDLCVPVLATSVYATSDVTSPVTSTDPLVTLVDLSRPRR